MGLGRVGGGSGSPAGGGCAASVVGVVGCQSSKTGLPARLALGLATAMLPSAVSESALRMNLVILRRLRSASKSATASTIAYEIGHLRLHQGRITVDSGLWFDYGDKASNPSIQEERDSSAFGASALMPAEAV